MAHQDANEILTAFIRNPTRWSVLQIVDSETLTPQPFLEHAPQLIEISIVVSNDSSCEKLIVYMSVVSYLQ